MAASTANQTIRRDTLAARMREAPVVADADTAALKLSQATERLDAAQQAELGALFAANPCARQVLLGVAEGSPFLLELIRFAPTRLLRCLGEPPSDRLAALIAEGVGAVRASPDEAGVMAALRRMRAEAALLIALGDMSGALDFAAVTGALTDIADAAITSGLDWLLREARAAGRLAPGDPDAPGQGCGLAVIAMGKHGARELNYSSDIDLIVVYDRDVAPLAAGVDASPFFVKLTKGLVRLLQERTGEGYVLRVDLRLRPDPGSTQVALSTAAALAYYEREGATWERAAYIKARPVAGDLEVGRAFLAELGPFVWRRILDYQAIADVHAMKREIHAFRGHDVVAVEGHNVKLGRGGIREVEFFVQTQQLIAGGRDPNLRSPRTLSALDALVRDRWIEGTVRDQLAEAYLFLRRVEHRIQMVADAQSHTLPEGREAFAQFARFMGYPDRDAFAAALVERLARVQHHYARLFEDTPPPAGLSCTLRFPPDTDDKATVAELARLGFRDPHGASVIVRGWLAGGHRVLRGAQARAHIEALIPLILDQLARGGDPDGALIAMDGFLSDLSGPQLLTALHHNPDLVRLLTTLLTAAPRLGETLARRPSLMDALLDPAFFDTLPDAAALAVALDRLLDTAESDEDQLDRVRRFRQEQHVLIGVRVVSGTLPAERAGEAYATLAEVIIRALHRRVAARFAEAHGTIAGAQTAVLAMGKLGGREMTAGSDLDLIVLYDFAAGADPASDGPRPLHGAQYFARFTQRLLSALTSLTNAGKLYDVDLRLRPSGRAGPVATRITSFESYQMEEAWTWEHMALTRARVIAAEDGFGARVEAVIGKVLAQPRDPRRIAGDILDMRRALAGEKGEETRWNLKHAAGGQVDVEFIAQYLVLVHGVDHPELVDTSTARILAVAGWLGLLPPEEIEILSKACGLYQDLTQVLRLSLDTHALSGEVSPALRALLARAGQMPDFPTLDAYLRETQDKVREIFVRVFEGMAG
ncbi:bifunctional [glutamine synthetase] adenylyltransferase/[glutamine synthetase]-adenylyl-L-tyrosine phosphorylase [Aquabacter spiritensis]|uniref:Bifunctional glutamine synthetase adenylyltransferase/adenylyl-removing enzyme n=1 Tax=Aquabacter spiritensis TaxID=933073 RepID=A0A4R3M2Z8_9HYPH|nr:bifunctional [glutamine synthetase] adenylyltransferase/[glutamine synthetase]-adenylyl-L-tyrosine phosphorylase [Aquabacter spiritensis]TCT07591.1 glutamate-ammonia-ligase adenylyltransferase [Aquabacter spiritensis]